VSLSKGTRLGPYEITAPLGAGGMGEVYKARDTRLERDVAIKVLPEHLQESPEQRRRFEHEARSLSQLQHPNLCALFDRLEEGLDFLVMELLDGVTLAECISQGPLTIREVLRIGGEVAKGIAAAHLKGLVHRDLKPGNVMLTPLASRSWTSAWRRGRG
jgi:eukaryotic-like serine/threonine-protein kinase